MQNLQLDEILVANNVLTEDQRAKALKTAQQARCPFAEAVIKMGFATEEDIAVAVSKQIGVPYASRENKILKVEKTQGLDKLVAETFARDNLVLPLFLDENVLAVAVANPDNMVMLDNLKVMTGREIQPFIATKTQLVKAIDEFYTGGGAGVIEKTMDKVQASGGGDADDSPHDDVKLDLDKEVGSGGKGQEAISIVNAILKQAVTEKCSDIHLECYDDRVMLRFRIFGVLYERMPPTKQMFNACVSRFKILSKLDIAERRLPQDGTFSMKVQNRVIDLRVSICPTVYGEKVVMRLLDKGAVELNIDKIGLEPEQKEDFLRCADAPHGLIFLTGPTGSGKTTTLNTVLTTIKTPELNFMTIEDPVEIKIEGINQVQVRSAIGLTFAAALRSFLRQDPDVILVGEVRDQETAQTCLRAAMTGHLVLSTLHTNDAMGTVPRLIDMGIEPFLLSGSLILAAAQRLVRTLCPHCKVPYKPAPEELKMVVDLCKLKPQDTPDLANLMFFKPKGCDKCARTGFAGRKAILEVFPIEREFRDIIYKHGGDVARLKAQADALGKLSLRGSGMRKVLRGLTTPDEVLSITIED
ncbi:MAG: Flp pilus assembly complex ATPase component TadA [Elusimicrobia bacterium]|nr:Flp pilus assembly complex ATPase component TadA [Elusimicrobiota bacterium]